MVKVERLVKHYGDVHAIDDIDFSLDRGEIFGLLGHNGAGKTTTMRLLTGRARPTSGRMRIAGFDVVTQLERVKPLINVVSDEQNLYERLSGVENLRFFVELYHMPLTRIDELLAKVGLTAASKRRAKGYSNGMKQRLLIARALVNQPRVLFLDEPTRGLDPAAAREVRHLLAQLSGQGTTICLTTHDMEEADALCHRVAFLSQGKIVALDTPRELKLRIGQQTAVVLLKDRDERTIQLNDPNNAALLEEWMRAGNVLTIHSQEGTLADVFIALAGRPL